jgi:hypothetical protein
MPGRFRIVGNGRLTALQVRVLELLAGVEPAWTLAGGAALAGFHLQHRATRDLDLFWRGQERLGPWREDVVSRLQAAGLGVDRIQMTPTLLRLRVSGEREIVLVDLIAEPSEALSSPEEVALPSGRILVDRPPEILTDKLCALLSRAEIRDLLDVRGLLATGGDLDHALRSAPQKDGGFSPLTLAWVLQGMPLAAMVKVAGISKDEHADLARFLEDLISQIVALADPEAER